MRGAAGAKARTYFHQITARLKSCPDTKPSPLLPKGDTGRGAEAALYRASGAVVRSAVTNVRSAHPEDYVFRNVGGVVGDTLEIAGD